MLKPSARTSALQSTVAKETLPKGRSTGSIGLRYWGTELALPMGWVERHGRIKTIEIKMYCSKMSTLCSEWICSNEQSDLNETRNIPHFRSYIRYTIMAQKIVPFVWIGLFSFQPVRYTSDFCHFSPCSILHARCWKHFRRWHQIELRTVKRLCHLSCLYCLSSPVYKGS
jgi:hypothetical protein